MKIPEQYLPVIPYLVVKNSNQLVEFMKNVFGATEQLIVPGNNGNVQHGEMRIGDAVIMLGEASDQWKEKTAAMYIYIKDVKDAYQKAMALGAKSLEEPQQKEFGFAASFEDPHGNYWFTVEGEQE